MLTSMRIRHSKDNTPRGAPFDETRAEFVILDSSDMCYNEEKADQNAKEPEDKRVIESRMLLYIKGKKNGRMMLESIEKGPFVYLTVEEEVQIQKKKYVELTKQKWLQDVSDVQETNIVLQGLPLDVYALVNHCQSAKDIWERVKLLMKGTELSYQEHELDTYIEFDKVTVQQVQGRQGQSFASMEIKGNATSSGGNNAAGHARVVKCYNCHGEGHMLMLAEAQESGQVLDEEQLAFLVDHGIAYCHDIQQTIIHDAAF
ncbi:hypothetical protein Tco_0295013 [Tanacetum coccineum]